MAQLSLLDTEDMRDFTQHQKYINGVFKTKEELTTLFETEGKNTIYRVLSMGGGTQSSYLLEQHFRGHIHYDFIVFADTGAEPQFIHDQVAWWQERQKAYGNQTPFIITTHKSMKGGLEEMLFRYIMTDYQRFQMPLYCNQLDENTGEEIKGGLLPRQCTVDYKIVPVKQTVRQEIMKAHGLTMKQQFPKNVGIMIDIGFSYDEIKRINTYQSPQFKYVKLAYPLVEEHLVTEDAIRFLADNEMPLRRSRCYFCPFNCDDRESGMDWEEIIEEEPLSFLKACHFDECVRETIRSGVKSLNSITYFHYSRQPLKEVYADHYSELYPLYKDELNAWINQWKDSIHAKYMA